MDKVALSVGLVVLALTAATQAGLVRGGDFLLVAGVGFAAMVFCLIVALEARSRLAAMGAALSALPVTLLAYFFLTSDG